MSQHKPGADYTHSPCSEREGPLAPVAAQTWSWPGHWVPTLQYEEVTHLTDTLPVVCFVFPVTTPST